MDKITKTQQENATVNSVALEEPSSRTPLTSWAPNTKFSSNRRMGTESKFNE